jgi:hypothetical protein
LLQLFDGGIGKKLKMLPKLSDKDAQKIKEIDSSVANKWKFLWLDCSVSISQGTDRDDVRIGDFFDKISLAGQAHCRLCIYAKVKTVPLHLRICNHPWELLSKNRCFQYINEHW